MGGMTEPSRPLRPALFIDFDGTLVDIVDEPGAVRVSPATIALLADLEAALEGALAVVSGRAVADLDRHLAPLVLAAAGLHGLERRPDPRVPVRRPPRPAALDRLERRLLAEAVPVFGARLEDKGATLAVHYRSVPQHGAAIVAAVRRAAAELPELHLVEGKMVIEAKPHGADKGSAVAAFLASAPFAGRTPVFLGDDVTDEDGFRAALAAGGIAIKVGDGPSCAPFRLGGVADVHAWLADLAAGLETGELRREGSRATRSIGD